MNTRSVVGSTTPVSLLVVFPTKVHKTSVAKTSSSSSGELGRVRFPCNNPLRV